MALLYLYGTLIALILGSTVAIASGRNAKVAGLAGAFGSIAGGVLASLTAIIAMTHPQPLDLYLPWSMPGGAIHLRIDAISSFFLLPIGILSAVTAIFGNRYMATHAHGRSLGLHWFFFNLLVASMVLVVTSANNLLFLLAWEIMSLTSFFLVMFDHDQKQVRSAGWMYLVTTHIGMVFLLVFFLLVQKYGGSPEIDRISMNEITASAAGVLFVFALIGFGSKAGLVPFHVWLPEAHPAAPSHVSALMSGVMIKMGIYGIVRTIAIIGPPAAWWGYLLIALGAISGILGILYALGQNDLKRLLAFSSVENIGIITLGLGCGVTGSCTGNSLLSFFGYTGAFLHVINHALFKGLLFLGAGSVLHATGTVALDQLGGLLKRMPGTAIFFLTGSIAICGIPPLNGFVSEFIFYYGAYQGIASSSMGQLVAGTAVAIALALIGGLALACFTKAFGIVFLGEPRTLLPSPAKDPGKAMLFSMAILAGLCLFIGLCSPFAARVAMAPAAFLCSLSDTEMQTMSAPLNSSLYMITTAALLLIVLLGSLAIFRRQLLKKRDVQTAVTWDCGYTKPSVRMQYTSTSFAQPVNDFFRKAIPTEKKFDAGAGAGTVTDFFPKRWTFTAQTHDFFLKKIFTPLFMKVEWALGKMRWLQGGKVHVYILYIALTIIALVAGELLWNR